MNRSRRIAHSCAQTNMPKHAKWGLRCMAFLPYTIVVDISCLRLAVAGGRCAPTEQQLNCSTLPRQGHVCPTFISIRFRSCRRRDAGSSTTVRAQAAKLLQGQLCLCSPGDEEQEASKRINAQSHFSRHCHVACRLSAGGLR